MLDKRIALGTIGVFVLSTVLFNSSIAHGAVSGNVTCVLKGSAVITPGLPLASPGNATKTLKTTTTFSGTLSNCSGTQTGTKGASIDGGTLVAVAKTKTAKGSPLPSCLGLAMPTAPTVLKATVKFTSAGKPIATSKLNLTVGAAVVAQQASFPATGTVSGGNGFKGQSLTANAVLDGPASALANFCTGAASTTFTFTDGSSMLEIQ